ncbi:serine/threonine-protein kinase [Mycolicibacterium vulneris]|nr:hypothetical protein A5721_30295 [Mycolicibacterium vulneris]
MLSLGANLNLNKKSWIVVGPLAGDGGGFGTLYVVRDSDGNEAAAKLVDKAPGAQREMLIGAANDAAQHRNVVSVLDDGEHGNQWVLVMPRAEKSLAKHLSENGGALSVDEAVAVLVDIATALSDINGSIVHRDLKPQNVLLLNGSWSLADFGISRYAEAATATDTHKYKLTMAYAAPEQWRLEHAEAAADVYAFGCVGYELLTGGPPFRGPDFRNQHLSEQPAELTVGSTRLRDLIEECLYKSPETRPTPTAILKRLQKIAEGGPTGTGLEKLAQANRVQIVQRSAAEAARSAERDETERKQRLHEAGLQSFKHIEDALLEAIDDHAPAAAVLRESASSRKFESQAAGKSFVAELLLGHLSLDKPQPSPAAGDNVPFTVITESVIAVQQQTSGIAWNGRSSSLWFCDVFEQNRFAWCEVAFMETHRGGQTTVVPFAMQAAHNGDAFKTMVIGSAQIARDFDELERADLSAFVNRWLGWFGEAATGELQRPLMLPEGRMRAGYWWTGLHRF